MNLNSTCVVFDNKLSEAKKKREFLLTQLENAKLENSLKLIQSAKHKILIVSSELGKLKSYEKTKLRDNLKKNKKQKNVLQRMKTKREVKEYIEKIEQKDAIAK